MRHITNLVELKNAIQHLESEQKIELAALNADIKNIINNCTPYHLFQWTFNDFSDKLISQGKWKGLAMGLGAGYLSKVFKIPNILLELEISTIVAQNADKIIAYAKKVLAFFQKNQKKSVVE